MSKVAIITDSNSGIKSNENYNIQIVPMPFIIGEEEFFEEKNFSSKEFYQALADDKKISTSQPSPVDVTAAWDNALKTYDEVIYIPMSSGLSRSYETAVMLSNDYNGKVQVVDAKMISVTQKQACIDAMLLSQMGKSAREIKMILESNNMNASIYIMVDTLKYLKRGGRITPVVAALGALLKIKPVLQIQGDKLDSFAKVLNIAQAKQKMIQAIKRDIEIRFKDDYSSNKLVLSVAHTNNLERAKEFAEEIKQVFPNIEFKFIDELSLSVSCHIGPGSLAVALVKKVS